MGDHFDFRGGVFNEPFIGKQVTQVTTVQTVVARPDDKMYVVMREDWMEGDYESDTKYVVGVAMSKERANDFIRNWVDIEGYLHPWFASYNEDGTIRREYRSDDHERMTLSVDVTNVL